MARSSGMILAIDQGTTSTKALLVDAQGQVVAQAAQPLTQHYPHPAWVEQDAEAIWQSVREAIEECLASAGDPHLAAIALSNQRESVTLWERKTGRPLGPVVSWQCRRTADFCAELRARGLAPWLAERTGLTIDPLFSASKMRWLLDHTPDSRQRAEHGELCLGTMDSWVLWNLSGGASHACDLTNASRTQLLDLRTLEWSAELQELFSVPAAALPALQPSSAVVGTSVALGRLPAGVPIAAMVGDSHGALFGQAGFVPGTVKATYGTGSSLMTPTPTAVRSQHGLSTTIAWALGPDRVTYALEGNIAMTGAAVQWLGEFLGMADPTAGVVELAERVTDAGALYVVPAMVGLGAPHWNDAARGLVAGLSHSSTVAHLARATVEAIAYQVRDVFDVMQAEAGAELMTLLADGGATQNASLMQFQADIIGRPVLRSTATNASALGAAYLAGLAVGIWQSLDQLAELPRPRERFAPAMNHAERATRYAGWQQAVARATLGTAQSASA
jgi:glycerol kinase